AMVDDLEIGRANGDGVDAYQDFRLFRHRYGLLAQRKLPGIPEHPRLHGIWDRVIRTRLHSGWCVHLELLPGRGPVSRWGGCGGRRNRSGGRLVHMSATFEGWNDRTPGGDPHELKSRFLDQSIFTPDAFTTSPHRTRSAAV